MFDIVFTAFFIGLLIGANLGATGNPAFIIGAIVFGIILMSTGVVAPGLFGVGLILGTLLERLYFVIMYST